MSFIYIVGDSCVLNFTFDFIPQYDTTVNVEPILSVRWIATYSYLNIPLYLEVEPLKTNHFTLKCKIPSKSKELNWMRLWELQLALVFNVYCKTFINANISEEDKNITNVPVRASMGSVTIPLESIILKKCDTFPSIGMGSEFLPTFKILVKSDLTGWSYLPKVFSDYSQHQDQIKRPNKENSISLNDQQVRKASLHSKDTMDSIYTCWANTGEVLVDFNKYSTQEIEKPFMDENTAFKETFLEAFEKFQKQVYIETEFLHTQERMYDIYHKWPHAGMRFMNTICSFRDVSIWSGNMIPALWSECLHFHSLDSKRWNDVIEYFKQSSFRAMIELGLSIVDLLEEKISAADLKSYKHKLSPTSHVGLLSSHTSFELGTSASSSPKSSETKYDDPEELDQYKIRLRCEVYCRMLMETSRNWMYGNDNIEESTTREHVKKMFRSSISNEYNSKAVKTYKPRISVKYVEKIPNWRRIYCSVLCPCISCEEDVNSSTGGNAIAKRKPNNNKIAPIPQPLQNKNSHSSSKKFLNISESILKTRDELNLSDLKLPHNMLKTRVMQSGDVWTLVRTLPDSSEHKADCDDKQIESLLNHVFIKYIIEQKELWAKVPKHIQSILSIGKHYVFGLATVGEMVQSLPELGNENYINSENQFYDSQFWNHTKSIKTQLLSDEELLDKREQYTSNVAGGHVLTFGFNKSLYEELILRGRKYVEYLQKLDEQTKYKPYVPNTISQIIDKYPTLILDATDDHSCFFGPDNERIPQPQWYEDFIMKFEESFPYHYMFSYPLPYCLYRNHKQYGFMNCMYFSDQVEGVHSGYLWWVNTRTHQFGIRVKDAVNMNNMRNPDWALVNLNSIQLKEPKIKYTEYEKMFIDAEMKTTSNHLSSDKVPLILDGDGMQRPFSEELDLRPMPFSCRICDWIIYRETFIECYKSMIKIEKYKKLKIGIIEKRNMVYKFIPWEDIEHIENNNIDKFKPELIQIHNEQKIYRFWFQL
jgi:hypothetical protein